MAKKKGKGGASKFQLNKLLLNKGEWIAIGVAGGLFLLLAPGVWPKRSLPPVLMPGPGISVKRPRDSS